jgi:hypothetical protein
MVTLSPALLINWDVRIKTELNLVLNFPETRLVAWSPGSPNPCRAPHESLFLIFYPLFQLFPDPPISHFSLLKRMAEEAGEKQTGRRALDLP